MMLYVWCCPILRQVYNLCLKTIIPISAIVKDDLLSTCRRLSATNACGKTLACGHVCPGFKQETTCPPCLYAGCKGGAAGVSQSGEDNCAICYTDSLREAPVVMVTTSYRIKFIEHFICIRRKHSVNFVFTNILFIFIVNMFILQNHSIH